MSMLNETAHKVVHRMRNAGYTALYVGGCVRDRCLGQEPQDYDIVTTATPSTLQRLFPKTIPVGAAFGTMIIEEEGFQFEVSTFRGPASTDDTALNATELLRQDVLHRDFTINTMAQNPDTGELFDFVDGQRDLERKIIRAVENPHDRFTEDPLRMIRAVRLAVQLGFHLETETEAAIRSLVQAISVVSPERIHQEVVGILLSRSPDVGFRLLHRIGLLPILLPEVVALRGVAQPPTYHPEGDVWTHTLLMLREMGLNPRPSPTLAFAVLFHDIGKPSTFTLSDRIRFDGHPTVGAELVKNIAVRYRWPRSLADEVCSLVQDHLIFLNVREMRRSTLIRWLRKPHFPELLELHRLDCLGSHRSLETYDFCRSQLASLAVADVRPGRLLTGHHLKVLGYSPGPSYREILSAVEHAQLEGALSTTEEAKRWVIEHYPIH